MDSIQSILSKLIAFQSITPQDAGCQDYLIDFLETLDFQIERFDQTPVSNFFARRGDTAPLLVFAGHTDVVAPGDESQWHTPPFTLEEKAGIYYGRGTADMKGSIASMMMATLRFIKTHPQFTGSLGFIITSGEEGEHFDKGTPYVMKQLHNQGIKPDYCIVGEPSSTALVGDVIKVGRRGSLSAKVLLQGKQGHVAYPHLAENPIHRLSPALAELAQYQWDKGNAHFPPTSLQMTEIHSGGQGGNIIPGDLRLHFNIRYSTEQTAAALKAAVINFFNKHQLHPSIEWRLNGEPFLTQNGRLLDSSVEVIKDITGRTPDLSTSGGTSDGRFIAPYGIEVIELGPVNATIHQINEHVASKDLEILSTLYYGLCEKLLLG